MNEGLKSFVGQAMTRTSKIWHYFVCAKLLPTTNFSAIMKNRAAFIYAIQKKKKLDIGLIIQNSIIHGFQTAIQGFAHPYLITELCQQAGVKWNKKEKVRASKAVIDNNLVFKI